MNTMQLQGRVVEMPRHPNYLRVADGYGDATVDIANLTEAELRMVGEKWTAELIKHANQRRALPPRARD